MEEMISRVNVIDVPVSVVTLNSVLKYISKNLNNLRGRYICAANAHTTVMAHEDEVYLTIQSEAAIVLPDGKPLSVIGRRKTKDPIEKVTGPNFMKAIFESTMFAGRRHFFYGTTKQDIDEMIAKLSKDYPNLEICGYEPSVFRELTDLEVDELASRINKSEADFIWIAIGAPRQEYLMYRLKRKVTGVMIGVGGAFHMLSGRVKQAPQWIQDMGLEWLYRLYKEPRRLFKRYLVTNTKFIYYYFTTR